MAKKIKNILILLPVFIATFTLSANAAPGVSVSINGVDSANSSNSLQILFLLTFLTILPSLLIMLTGFTRIVIVLSFVKNALGIQQTPPNQVLVGLALFLTLFIMSPIVSDIQKTAYTPFSEGIISQEEAVDRAIVPIKRFMLKQTRKDDLNMFLDLSKSPKPDSIEDLPMSTVIPAFITSELKTAFIMGFLIFLPFLVIDMVVASVLMSMGMVMLPPAMISLPFKIILFVLVNGWGNIVKTLVKSFN